MGRHILNLIPMVQNIGIKYQEVHFFWISTIFLKLLFHLGPHCLKKKHTEHRKHRHNQKHVLLIASRLKTQCSPNRLLVENPNSQNPLRCLCSRGRNIIECEKGLPYIIRMRTFEAAILKEEVLCFLLSHAKNFAK